MENIIENIKSKFRFNFEDNYFYDIKKLLPLNISIEINRLKRYVLEPDVFIADTIVLINIKDKILQGIIKDKYIIIYRWKNGESINSILERVEKQLDYDPYIIEGNGYEIVSHETAMFLKRSLFKMGYVSSEEITLKKSEVEFLTQNGLSDIV